MPLLIEWDEKKAQRNITKHGASFKEAATVFGDLQSFTIEDPLHSEEENRFVTIGESFRGRILVVVHTERDSNIRIVSARTASRRERKLYEEGNKDPL